MATSDVLGIDVGGGVRRESAKRETRRTLPEGTQHEVPDREDGETQSLNSQPCMRTRSPRCALFL